ncbi:MAG TPA: hypothetical protein DCQ31_17680 [Bacteroidales bacterium]|nr:hypothetical protein [Bacteroidales bacterium]
MKTWGIFWGIGFLFLIFSSGKLYAQTPDTPVLESVSIEITTGTPVLKWKPVDVATVNGFIIYRKLYGVVGIADGTKAPIDTLYDNSLVSYYDNISTKYGFPNPAIRAETYSIAAFKTSGIDLLLSTQSDDHTTVFINEAKYDPCAKEVVFKWSLYAGWPEISSIKVMFKKTTEVTYNILQTLPGNYTEYRNSILDPSASYEFFITMQNMASGYVAQSNLVQVNTTSVAPAFINADYASVIADGKLELQFTFDDSKKSKVELRSSETENGEYRYKTAMIGTSPTKTVVDQFTTTEPFFYKLVALNECDQVTIQSNPSSNMVVSVSTNSGTEFVNSIGWTPYRSYKAGVNVYNVYRKVDDENWQLLQTVNTADARINDNVSSIQQVFTTIPHKYCYYVEAIENTTNPHGVLGTSISNVKCATYSNAKVFPTAFNPTSDFYQNRFFRPSVSPTVTDYKLAIYNRWGELVFESNKVENGWEGNVQGRIGEKGVYVYLIQYTDGETGEKVKQSGYLTLIY